MEKINVFIVDDHPLFLEGITSVLARDGRFHLAGTAERSQDALQKINNLDVKIVICDYMLPEMNGLELMTATRMKKPDLKYVFISQYQNVDILNQIIQAEIDGFVFKTDSIDEVFRAIESVNRGDKFLSPKVSTFLLSNTKKVSTQNTYPKADVTEREKEISRYITQGKTNKEIGVILKCSEHTVKCHKSNLMRKLGLKNAAEVSAWAMRQQFIEQQE
jgi:DNA-binding NarL/FixJ family response regulator